MDMCIGRRDEPYVQYRKKKALLESKAA